LYRPAHFPNWPGLKGIRTVVQFGKFASATYIFGQIGRGAPTMIIGRTQDMAGVALFSRANGLVELFNAVVMRSVAPVCLPYFAQSHREQGGLPRGYLLSISYITVIGWPFLAFMATVAYAAVRLVYGPQWMASVPLAQILCLVGAVELIHSSAKEALMAGGGVKQSNTLQIIIQFTRITCVFAGVTFGLVGACWGLLGAAAVGAVASQIILGRVVGLQCAAVFKACLPSLLITLLSVAPSATWVFIVGIDESNYAWLSAAAGALTMLAWLLAVRLLRHPLWTEVSKLAQKFMPKREACPS
jgi:O-antigen/teichoic acid export membrane protein